MHLGWLCESLILKRKNKETMHQITTKNNKERFLNQCLTQLNVIEMINKPNALRIIRIIHRKGARQIAERHFAERHFAAKISPPRHFAATTFRRCDISPLRHFAAATYRRYDISPPRHFAAATFRRYDISSPRQIVAATFRRCDNSPLRHIAATTFRRLQFKFD